MSHMSVEEHTFRRSIYFANGKDWKMCENDEGLIDSGTRGGVKCISRHSDEVIGASMAKLSTLMHGVGCFIKCVLNGFYAFKEINK